MIFYMKKIKIRSKLQVHASRPSLSSESFVAIGMSQTAGEGEAPTFLGINDIIYVVRPKTAAASSSATATREAVWVYHVCAQS